MKTEAIKGKHNDRPKAKLHASHIYRDLRDLVWPRRNLFAVGLVLVFINRAAGLVLPGSTKYLIDDVLIKGNQSLLWTLALISATAAVVSGVTDYALARRAVAAGATVAISSDCHRAEMLARQMDLGIVTARRGWARPGWPRPAPRWPRRASSCVTTASAAPPTAARRPPSPFVATSTSPTPAPTPRPPPAPS